MGLGGARRDGAHQGLTMSTIALRAVLPECQPDDDGRDTTVSLHRISKHFGHLRAIDDVCLSVRSGEIHALLGENGAGKSTLMNILSGTYQPDAGEIRVDNVPIRFGSPAAAIAAGIGMVHQHFKLVDAFTVAENLHIGWVKGPWWRSQRTLVERTRMLAEQMNLTVDPEACVGDLSAGEQQRVELLRVLARGARVLILDEPTAVLTPRETVELLRILQQFRASGRSILLISHKLGEVLEIADRITVLRKGRVVATLDASSCDQASLSRMMVGESIARQSRPASRPVPARLGPTRLGPTMRLRGVTVRGRHGLAALDDISLDVWSGEILGIAGVAGNGQRELSEVLAGMRRPDKGALFIDDTEMTAWGAAEFVDRGIGHVPEDRLKTALMPASSIAENLALREYRTSPIARGALVDETAMVANALQIASDARVDIEQVWAPVGNLSGGNQQRLVLRREIRIARRALIAAYPSRGLDVGATNSFHQQLLELRSRGIAVILISEELDELLDLADEIAVLSGGRISGLVRAGEADREQIGLWMGGGTTEQEAVP